MTHLTTEQIEDMPRTYLDTLTRKLTAAQEGHHTMTHEPTFADDFTVTQEQADNLNARIAADKETTTMQYRALNATELKQYVHEHPEFITCPKCEGKAYSDGTENHLGWRVMCCTCNGHGLVTPKEGATTMQTTTKRTTKQQEQYEAIAELKGFIQPGDTLFIVQRHVSQSGMKRILSVYASGNAPDGKARLRNITFSTAHALQWKLQDHGGSRGIVVNGCGMDMHFHTVYTLASVLFDDGYALTHETL